MLITGGSKGLGLAAAQQLAAKGANIVIAARGQESLTSAIKSVAVSLFDEISPMVQAYFYNCADAKLGERSHTRKSALPFYQSRRDDRRGMQESRERSHSME